jgi:hypothetical protein
MAGNPLGGNFGLAQALWREIHQAEILALHQLYSKGLSTPTNTNCNKSCKLK